MHVILWRFGVVWMVCVTSAMAQNPAGPALSGTTAVTLFDQGRSPTERMELFRRLGGDHRSPLKFEGPGGDRNLMSRFRSDGQWTLGEEGDLRPGMGNQAALTLGEHQHFQLQLDGVVPPQGGWFLVFGWTPESGQLLYHVTLKKSSAWYLYEARRGEFTQRKAGLSDQRRVGGQRLTIRVESQELRVSDAAGALAIRHPLERPGRGTVYLGVTPTQYGPTALQIRRLTLGDLE